MDSQTKEHILSFEEPEPLREHLHREHVRNRVENWRVVDANHQELDQTHIEAHR